MFCYCISSRKQTVEMGTPCNRITEKLSLPSWNLEQTKVNKWLYLCLHFHLHVRCISSTRKKYRASTSKTIAFTIYITLSQKQWFPIVEYFILLYVKKVSRPSPQESVGGCSSPSSRPWGVGGEPLMSVTRGQCDARPIRATFPAAKHHRLSVMLILVLVLASLVLVLVLVLAGPVLDKSYSLI